MTPPAFGHLPTLRMGRESGQFPPRVLMVGEESGPFTVTT
jgi:hypothetical protein